MIKILVIGLDGADPELLLGDERLTNLRRLMEFGCYGRLESAIPPGATPAWMCMASGQDPRLVGTYGQANRSDRAYDGPQGTGLGSRREATIWDQVVLEGGHAILVDVPPSFPPREIEGISVSFTIPAGSSADVYTYPASVRQEIVGWVGEYPLVASEPGSEGPGSLGDRVRELSRDQFATVRHLMYSHRWDYLQYVESGLARLQRGICQHGDLRLVSGGPESAGPAVIGGYYRFLDGELGAILEALDEDAAVLVVCLPGAQGHGRAPHGAFVLAASNSPLQGEVEGAHVADLAPTLLELAGYGVPRSMQGRSLVAGQTLKAAADAGLAEDEEEILRERLSGLGYL